MPGVEFAVEAARWFRAPLTLAHGRVLGGVSRASAWDLGGLAEGRLDADAPELHLRRGGADLRLRLANGSLAIENNGREALDGEGSYGRVRIHAGFGGDALPGEIHSLRLGAGLLTLRTASNPAARDQEALVAVPPGTQAPSTPGLRRIPVLGCRRPTWLGHLWKAAGLRAWFRADVAGRVDGRPAREGDVVPVAGVMSLLLDGFPPLFPTV
jgi:hypothetical protein